ncbi:MAG: vitamin K epoxide reductase family protein [Anaerolineae bacterium]|nr:vitamin K epoxide reductase family protein [Anaerolineae bacterium]
MLVIGSEVLIGSVSIPESAPTIIRTGVQNGGIALPSLPGVEDLYRATVDGNGGAVAYIGRADPATSANSAGQTPIERLSRDPVANLLAILILVLLLFTLVGLAVGGWQYATERNPRWLRTMTKRARPDMLLLLSAIGAAITLSLLAGWSNDWFILLLAGGELLVFSSVMIGVNSALKAKPLPRWIVPVLAIAGIAVATYLTYIELTLSSAVCGLLGNCNLVQQSAYARILNVPIGVLGLVGYGAIMLMWLLRRGALEWANRALLALAVFGVAFSTYLTFLEPFVIGATCMWCLLSAVLMLMLLWSLITPVSKPSRRGH